MLKVCKEKESAMAFGVWIEKKFLHSGSQEALFAGFDRLEKYLNLEGFLEKSMKIKSALKSTGKSPKSLKKSLNSTIFYRN